MDGPLTVLIFVLHGSTVEYGCRGKDKREKAEDVAMGEVG